MDYRILPHCQFQVPIDQCPQDCAAPAVAVVWFEDADEMYVCEQHLDHILVRELRTEREFAQPAG